MLCCLLIVAACGGEEEEETGGETEPMVECGPGTVLQEQTCVVAEIDCPEGQVPTPAGICADPDVYCGTGASYDTATERCVSTVDIRCGEGTIEVGGRCVVEDAQVCGPGTVLADGECVISESVCGTGTSLEGIYCELADTACAGRTEFDVVLGQCVDTGLVECGTGTIQSGNRCVPFYTEAEELAAAADVVHSQSATISLGSNVGDQVVFTGTMNPGNLFHNYNLNGTEGQWVSIRLYSLGLPSPGFRIRQTVGTWERRVSPGFSSVPHREVVFPTSGQFDLIVSTSVSGAGGTFGSTDWRYVGVIEVIEGPEPRQWDIFEESLTGNLQETAENFIRVDVPANSQALITPGMLGVDADQVTVEVWESPTTFSERVTAQEGTGFVLPGGGLTTKYLLVDARDFLGPRTDFAMHATETLNLPAGVSQTEEFFAEAGEMLFISHRNDGETTLSGRVVRDGLELYSTSSLLAENRSSYTMAQTHRDYFYVPEDGTYQVVIENTTSNTVTGFLPTSSVGEVPTFEIGPDESTSFSHTFSTNGLARGFWSYVVIDSDVAFRIEGEVSVGSGDPEVYVLNLDRDQLFSFTSAGTTESVNFTIEEAGTYLMIIRPWNALGGGMEVELEGTPLQALQPGDSIVQEFSASTFDILHGEVSYGQGGAPDLRLLNQVGDVVFEDAPMSSTSRTILELLPANGDYTLELVNNSDTPALGAVVDIEVDTPVEYMDFADEFDETFTAPFLGAGDRVFYLMRTRSNFNHLVVGQADAGEFTMRFWNMLTGSTVSSNTGEEEVIVGGSNQGSGLYLVELIAESDLEEGYQIQWSSTVSNVIEVTSDPISVSGIMTTDSQIVISGCPVISEIELIFDFENGNLWRMDLDFLLTAPSGDSFDIWNLTFSSTTPGNSFAVGEFVFPTDHEPIDSFDPLFGQNGNGTWNLDVDHSWASTSDVFTWTLRLSC